MALSGGNAAFGCFDEHNRTLNIEAVKSTPWRGVHDVHHGPVLTSGAGDMLIASWMTTTSAGAWGVSWCGGCSCRRARPSRSRSSARICGRSSWSTSTGVADRLRALAEHGRGVRARPARVLDVPGRARAGLGSGRGEELGEFAAWARRPAENVVVLAEEAARLSARTVNRMLSGVVGFYEFQARRGSTLAQDLVVKTRRAAAATSRFCTGSRAAARAGGRCGCPSASAAEDAVAGAGGGGDRLPGAAARPVPVRAVGVDGDADRPGAGAAPRGRGGVGAADRDPRARGRAAAGAQQGRREGGGAGRGRADAAVERLHARGVPAIWTATSCS